MIEDDVVIFFTDAKGFDAQLQSNIDEKSVENCPDFPGDTTKRLTLYVDMSTLKRVGDKYCGNWATSPGDACVNSKLTYKLSVNGALYYEYKSSCARDITQVEFGLSEPMSMVFPLVKSNKCGNYGGNTIKVKNRDLSRSVEVDIEIDVIPDASDQYPITRSYSLHPGGTKELGCSEKSGSSMTFEILDARFI